MKKVIIFFLILVLAFSIVLTGCDGCSDIIIESTYDDPEYATDAKTGQALMFVENHETDYVVVIGENAHAVEVDAANELQFFVQEATGAELKIVRDNTLTVTNEDKVVLLGDTTHSTTLTAEYDELGDSGFKMNLSGNNVVLKGATPEGTLYSAYEFLSKVLNFEVYAINEYYIDKVANVKMLKIENVVDIPAIDYRNPGWYMANDPMIKRMRLINPTMSGTSVYGKDWGTASHSIRNEILPKGSEYENQDLYPGWIYKNGHICMSKEILSNGVNVIDIVADKLLRLLQNVPTARTLELGHPDDSARCECSDCAANIQKYGSITGVYMVWLNKVATALEQKMTEVEMNREVTVQGIMYNAYQAAPAVMNADGTVTPNHPDVMAKTNGMVKVSARYTPIAACFAHPLNDTNCKINSAGKYADELRKWRYIVGDNKLQFYGYVAEFYDYMMFFNDIGMMNGSYKFFGEMDLYGIFDSAVNQSNINGPFVALKVYLKSKLMWNPELDIRTLIDNFYNHYFGVAGSYMKEVYDGVMANFAEISEVSGSGGCYGFRSAGADYKSPDYWPVDLLFELQSSIDKAYEAVENSNLSAEEKEKLYWRIKADELFPMHWFVNNYSSSFSEEEAEAMKKDFDESCAYLGITKFTH